MENTEVARIKPFVYDDEVTGQRIEVRASNHFATIRVGDRVYYFAKESGEFDGTSRPMGGG